MPLSTLGKGYVTEEHRDAGGSGATDKKVVGAVGSAPTTCGPPGDRAGDRNGYSLLGNGSTGMPSWILVMASYHVRAGTFPP